MWRALINFESKKKYKLLVILFKQRKGKTEFEPGSLQPQLSETMCIFFANIDRELA